MIWCCLKQVAASSNLLFYFLFQFVACAKIPPKNTIQKTHTENRLKKNNFKIKEVKTSALWTEGQRDWQDACLNSAFSFHYCFCWCLIFIQLFFQYLFYIFFVFVCKVAVIITIIIIIIIIIEIVSSCMLFFVLVSQCLCFRLAWRKFWF